MPSLRPWCPNSCRERCGGPAFGTLATATALGITVGTPAGGHHNRLSIVAPGSFLVNIPVGIAAIYVCQRVMPNDTKSTSDKDRKEHNGFDLPGAFLSFASSLALIYGLSTGQEKGWLSPVIAGSFLSSSLGTFYTFIRHEKKNSSAASGSITLQKQGLHPMGTLPADSPTRFLQATTS